jgi:hypothetical protein
MQSSNLLLESEDTYKYLLQFLDAKSFLVLSRTSKSHYNQNKQFANKDTEEGKNIKGKLSVIAKSILDNSNEQINRRNENIETAAMIISVPVVAMKCITFFIVAYAGSSMVFNNEIISFVIALTCTAGHLLNAIGESRNQAHALSVLVKEIPGVFASGQHKRAKELIENQKFLALEFKP